MAASGRDRRVRIPMVATARQYRFDAMFEVPRGICNLIAMTGASTHAAYPRVPWAGDPLGT